MSRLVQNMWSASQEFGRKEVLQYFVIFNSLQLSSTFLRYDIFRTPFSPLQITKNGVQLNSQGSMDKIVGSQALETQDYAWHISQRTPQSMFVWQVRSAPKALANSDRCSGLDSGLFSGCCLAEAVAALLQPIQQCQQKQAGWCPVVPWVGAVGSAWVYLVASIGWFPYRVGLLHQASELQEAKAALQELKSSCGESSEAAAARREVATVADALSMLCTKVDELSIASGEGDRLGAELGCFRSVTIDDALKTRDIVGACAVVRSVSLVALGQWLRAPGSDVEKALRRAMRARHAELNQETRRQIAQRVLGIAVLHGRLKHLLEKVKVKDVKDVKVRDRRDEVEREENLREENLRDGKDGKDGEQGENQIEVEAEMLLELYVCRELKRGAGISAFSDGLGYSQSCLDSEVKRKWLLEAVTCPLFEPEEKPSLAVRLATAWSLPLWMAESWLQQFGPLSAFQLGCAMCQPARVTLRVNSFKTTRLKIMELLAEHGVRSVPTAESPVGLWLPDGRPPGGGVWQLPGYSDGLFEVQDEGSQLLALATEAKAGELVVDYCAGRGGKTWFLASLVAPDGSVCAWDIDEDLRKQLQGARANRALGEALHLLQVPTSKPQNMKADVVLVDAPCSSSGVLRRHPSQRWALNFEELSDIADLQLEILKEASELVRPGGRLVYATCSLIHVENQRVVFKARSIRTGELVAMKQMKIEGSAGSPEGRLVLVFEFVENDLKKCPMTMWDAGSALPVDNSRLQNSNLPEGEQIPRLKVLLDLVGPMGSSGVLVALEPGDLDFQRNLPQSLDGTGSFKLVQVPSKRCWEAVKQLCPSLDARQGVGDVGMPQASLVSKPLEDSEEWPHCTAPQAPLQALTEVICVEDEHEETPTEPTLREAVPSLREAAPSLTLGDMQIVEIDPDEIREEPDEPAQLVANEDLGQPALQNELQNELVPLSEPEREARNDQFGPQARAAFKPPRGCIAAAGGHPEAPAVVEGCDGSLLGPNARHQFKKPRVLATPARAVSSLGPVENATSLRPPAPKLPQSTVVFFDLTQASSAEESLNQLNELESRLSSATTKAESNHLSLQEKVCLRVMAAEKSDESTKEVKAGSAQKWGSFRSQGSGGGCWGQLHQADQGAEAAGEAAKRRSDVWKSTASNAGVKTLKEEGPVSLGSESLAERALELTPAAGWCSWVGSVTASLAGSVVAGMAPEARVHLRLSVPRFPVPRQCHLRQEKAELKKMQVVVSAASDSGRCNLGQSFPHHGWVRHGWVLQALQSSVKRFSSKAATAFSKDIKEVRKRLGEASSQYAELSEVNELDEVDEV
eukprot:Skav227188  [mRNA]  locus=scaffold2048:110119:130442:+ [translate_table: standard]